MCLKQCMGVTKRGARCLIKVNTGEFCHYHVPRQPDPKTRPDPRLKVKQPNQKPHKKYATNPSLPPVPPRKTQLHVHITSKNYTTSSSVGAVKTGSRTYKSGDRQLGPIKYNNLDRPLVQAGISAGNRRPIDYTSIPSSPKHRYSPKAELAIQPGFIYVYTLSSFLSKHADGGWIQTRNLSRNKRHQDKWVDVDMRRLQKMLVKVGMTTKTPAIRIQQWEAKCNHDLQCLYPGSHPHLGKSSLSRMLGNLSLKNNSEAEKYSTYVEKYHGFWVPRNILHCEQQIHLILKQKYGRGEIHCTGCHDKPEEPEMKRSSILDMFRTKEEPPRTDYNIHNEWFPIPRKKLSEVFSIINTECMKYLP